MSRLAWIWDLQPTQKRGNWLHVFMALLCAPPLSASNRKEKANTQTKHASPDYKNLNLICKCQDTAQTNSNGCPRVFTALHANDTYTIL